MTAAKMCELTELPRSMCSHCRGLDTPEPVTPPPPVGLLFGAKFPGVCVSCDQYIRVGDLIHRVNSPWRDTVLYAHRDCG